MKLLSCDLPLTQAVDSQKHVFWFNCDFGSARPLPAGVFFSLQVPFDDVGLCTYWQLGFLWNFSSGKTYTFKGCNVCVFSLIIFRHNDSNILLPAVKYCPYISYEWVVTQSNTAFTESLSNQKSWDIWRIVSINFQGLIYFKCCRTVLNR